MSKRNTETEKWRDPWFRKLTPADKLAWLYMVDVCDIAGVWDPDFEMANFAIGTEPDWEGLPERLGERLEVIEGGKWHLTKFVEFQCGKLSEGSHFHRKVIETMESHGISKVGYLRGSYTHKVRKSKVKQGKEEQEEASLAEIIYAAFPKKVGKAKALKAIESAIAETGDADRLLQRTRSFAKATERWPEADRRFIKHPTTWFNQGCYDDDPAEWERTPPPAPNGANGHSDRRDPLGLL